MASGVGQPAYRWVVVAAVAVIFALALGQLVNGLSVFFLPLEREFGWQRGDIALINTAGVVGVALGGIVMGRLAERLGTRPVALFGAAVLGLCVLGASLADSLWQFYLLFFAAGALGGAAFFAPLIALVSNWFAVGAGLAIGIASAGQAMGQGGVPFVAALLIEQLGWRGAFVALGAASLAVLLPLALLMRDPPRPAAGARAGEVDESPTALPHRAVVVTLSIAVVGCCTLMSVPLMHLVPLMQGCGIPGPEAGGVMVAMLAAGIAGRICFGRLADMIGAIPAYMTASLWQTLMVFGFTRIDSLEGFYLYAPLYGFGYAGVMTGLLTTTRALTRPSRRAGAMGIVGAFAWLGHGLGGWQGGLLFDLTGTYAASFAVATAAGVFNLAVMTGLALAVRRGRIAQPA
ncbi:Major Facilitator Superfamily protein [Tistlia consotensis]|uniref:Major Facilitator Superfamily protein n=1 Tax=Tistlia consotensis USBA 355 TaxID=560819 RepID=A0A1Y6CCW9_9PROT|nr:MFS transporter [Tistlia consotensis]SMF48728.1 Major Facilitator Superfamily protein [Tistlia consotensis USBA 355]SNR80829.1 Major Facilitator Superfamily protein [Tistlia consotensis]